MGKIKSFLSRLNSGIRRLLAETDPIIIAEKYRKKGVKIGEGTYIYPDVTLGRGGKDPIVIGRNCILTGCTILGHDASTNRALDIKKSIINLVEIEDDCFIGNGAIILMGVKIGRGSIVGAGAVVASNIDAGQVVIGNPARVLCSVKELIQERRRLQVTNPEFFPDLTSAD